MKKSLAMNRKQIWKIAVDVGMTAVLLLLMAYSLVGETAHEWLGIGIFALFITHHILNNGWCRNVFKGKYTPIRSWAVRMTGYLIAGYGVYAFVKREIGSYMFLRTQFVFFDFGEPLIFFLLDYIAVMGLFVFIGHYISKGLKAYRDKLVVATKFGVKHAGRALEMDSRPETTRACSLYWRS